jgi:hypothetical protein
LLPLGPDVAAYTSKWCGLKWLLSFVNENQARKEAEKTAVTKVVVAADKAKEQELKSRTREVMVTTQEQTHISHEQVG